MWQFAVLTEEKPKMPYPMEGNSSSFAINPYSKKLRFRCSQIKIHDGWF